MSGRIADHPAVLGSQIIGEFSTALGKPAYVIDPPDVDEFDDIARISGIKGIYRESHVHVLNQKEVARRMAAELGKRYDECNFIVCHIGGGLSIAAHKQGRMVDANDVVNGEGPMAPNRSGYVPLLPLVKKCCADGAEYGGIEAMIAKTGGLKSLTGTDDMLEIKAKRDGGDRWSALVYDAFAYNLAKYIGSYACVLEGRVDAIIMTGGVSNDEEFIDNIRKYAGWIAPVKVYGGDFEMESIAAGVLRVIRGEEEPKEYTGVPVFSGFEYEPETV
jgi:butyrate kinase